MTSCVNEEDICCPICLDRFRGNMRPKVLICGHSFCEPCLVSCCSDLQQFRCALCKKDQNLTPGNVKDLPTNHALLSVAESGQDVEDRNNKDVEDWNPCFLHELQAKGATIFEATHDREGRNVKELTLKKGDIVEVLDRSRNWWKLRNARGDLGHAPYTVLHPYSVNKSWVSLYEATNNREGRDAKELTLKKGDIVEVLDRSRNWWKLRNESGDVGHAPYTVLQPYSMNKSCVSLYEATNNREGRNAKELTLKKGDIVEVLDRSLNWWKLRNASGDVGHAPYTILQPYFGDSSSGS